MSFAKECSATGDAAQHGRPLPAAQKSPRELFVMLSEHAPLTPELIRKVRRVRERAARIDAALREEASQC